MKITHRCTVAVVPFAVLLACSQESDQPTFPIQAHSFKHSEWSAPVNLGTTINTGANEQGPQLSNDGLSLFFGSDRAGGFGAFDLWVARRTCRDCPWQAPENLGSVINTAASETGPGLSVDGHLLFYTGVRAGAPGGQDLFMSRRSQTNDDVSWGSPVALGTGVNTTASEAGAEYLQNAEEGAGDFYFNRAPPGGTADIYYVGITRDGETRGPATLVAELSHPVATDQGSTLRSDAKEIVFFSTRPGGFGGNDLWTSSRRNANDAWAPPENLGALFNTSAAEQQPSFSFDGRTLLFASSRTGGFGGTDIWMSTRTPSGH